MFMQSKQLLAYILILYQGILHLFSKKRHASGYSRNVCSNPARGRNRIIPDINYGISDHQSLSKYKGNGL